MLIETFLSPTIWLVRRAVRDCFSSASTSTSSEYQETLAHAAEAQDILVTTLGWMINVVVFGQFVPPLMLLAPLCGWLQLCTHVQVQGRSLGTTCGQAVATGLVVQMPITSFSILAHVGIGVIVYIIFIE